MKRFFVLLIILLVSGCASKSSEENLNYLDNIAEHDIENIIMSKEAIGDLDGYKNQAKQAPYIFVGKVKSIKSATCNLAGKTYSPMPFTLGEIEVLKSYKGNVTGTISFAKLGGIVTIEEFDRNAPEETLDMRIKNRENSGIAIADAPSYVSVYAEGDIALSTDKPYLFYAQYDNENKQYEIVGLMYGTLEIKNYGKEQAAIFEPDTKEEISLETYIENNK